MDPRRVRSLVLLVPAAALAAAALAWALRGDAAVPAVREGDQEVAWIHAATSGSTWERFVAGVRRAAHDDPRLHVDDARAFLDQTTAVPEVALSADGLAGKLRIRWYKLTSESDSAYLVRQLAARSPAPLAFIGGGTSDRALELARALAGQTEWKGERPLLLIMTATANSVSLDPFNPPDMSDPDSGRLIRVYKDRSFRVCFTNEQMAEAVVDFLWSQPDLSPIRQPLRPLAAAMAAAEPWSGLAAFAARAAESAPAVTAFAWQDDPYSIDLSKQFHQAFHQPHRPHVVGERRDIFYSVGGVYRPNRWEAEAAELLQRDLRDAGLDRQILVLPAGPPQARRVLRSVVGSLPLAGRNLVAVTGDSIGFNHLYRDADFAWNVRAVPVPLVVFAHQNPVAWDSAAGSPLRPPSGADDVLLFRDLVRLLTDAALPVGGPVAAGAGIVAERLRRCDPPVFDAAGDRLGGRGEHVIVVRPQFLDPGTPVLVDARLEVWARTAEGWKFLERLTIDHGRTPRNP